MTPYTLLTKASVSDVNKRLPDGMEVTPDWYRPNLVIETNSGTPYEEDGWKGRVRFEFHATRNLFWLAN